MTRNSITTRCYQFSLQVIRLTDSLPKKRSSWVISDQLIRSATSVGANLVEGKGSSSRKEFARFNHIALRSAYETTYWLKLLMDSQLAEEEAVQPLIRESIELRRMIAAGLLKLKGRR